MCGEMAKTGSLGIFSLRGGRVSFPKSECQDFGQKCNIFVKTKNVPKDIRSEDAEMLAHTENEIESKNMMTFDRLSIYFVQCKSRGKRMINSL